MIVANSGPFVVVMSGDSFLVRHISSARVLEVFKSIFDAIDFADYAYQA